MSVTTDTGGTVHSRVYMFENNVKKYDIPGNGADESEANRHGVINLSVSRSQISFTIYKAANIYVNETTSVYWVAYEY